MWRIFNQFLIKLDARPATWEDRVALFCAHIIDNGAQSQTVRSYVSAIKIVLKLDGHTWDDSKVLINCLTKACRVQNDKLKCRLPIQKGLFEMILFELKRTLSGQVYLQTMYRALFCLGYYGLMRIGELAEGVHSMKACNIHIGINKNKILVILYTSKTHSLAMYPQKIKIEQLSEEGQLICPFQAIRSFLAIRGGYESDGENFFIFRDGTNVLPDQVRNILRGCLLNLNLNAALYDTHSLRIGRSCDLARYNWPLERIKTAGRWRSNAVYRYLRQ